MIIVRTAVERAVLLGLCVCTVSAFGGCSAPSLSGTSGNTSGTAAESVTAQSAAAQSGEGGQEQKSGESRASSIEHGVKPGAEVEEALNKRFTKCDSLEEAADLAGFPISVPDTIVECEQVSFRAIKGEMVEVNYLSKGGWAVRLRKGPGQDDISGDYNEYRRFDFSIINDLSVFQRFDDEGVRVATWTNGTWTNGTYTYAVTSSKGLTGSELETLIDGFV